MRKIIEVFGEPIISGGQEAFAVNVLKNYNDPGTVFDFFTPYYCGNEYYRSLVEQQGGTIYESGLPFTPGKRRENTYIPLCNILGKTQYDVVHIHSGSLSFLALASKAAKKNGIKTIIVHSHSPAERETVKHLAAKLRYYRTLKTCPTHYLACSEEAAGWKFPKDVVKRNVTIIKNGIDIKKYLPDAGIRANIREKVGIGENTAVIGHVGRFSHEKNHEYMIDLLELVLKEKPDTVLLLVGDGELRPRVREKAAGKKLDKSVIFTGNVDNVNEYMQAMDVFILPSLYEGLPLVAVEAQAAGLPVLVSDRVSAETDITGKVRYIPLSDQALWVKTIVEALGGKREDNCSVLRSKGYDIESTVESLNTIYKGECDDLEHNRKSS